MQQEFVDLRVFLNEHFTFIDRRFDDIDLSVFDIHEEIKKLHQTDARLEKRIDTLTTSVDSFIKLHQTIDVELVAHRAKTERLEARIERLEKIKE